MPRLHQLPHCACLPSFPTHLFFSPNTMLLCQFLELRRQDTESLCLSKVLMAYPLPYGEDVGVTPRKFLGLLLWFSDPLRNTCSALTVVSHMLVALILLGVLRLLRCPHIPPLPLSRVTKRTLSSAFVCNADRRGSDVQVQNAGNRTHSQEVVCPTANACLGLLVYLRHLICSRGSLKGFFRSALKVNKKHSTWSDAPALLRHPVGVTSQLSGVLSKCVVTIVVLENFHCSDILREGGQEHLRQPCSKAREESCTGTHWVLPCCIF